MGDIHIAFDSPRLPPELLEMVVDSLAGLAKSDLGRRSALLACHFVSSSFCHFSRRHLFRKIELTDSNNPEDLSSSLIILHELIGLDSGIANYIKEFSFDLEREETEKKLIGDNSTLVAVLEALHGPDHEIQNFTLSSLWLGLNWLHLNGQFQRAFLNLVISPRLSYLCLRNIYNLPVIFLVGTHIKHLQLYNCVLDAEPVANHHLRYSPENLQSKPEVLDTDLEIPLLFFERTIDSKIDTAINSLRVPSSSIFECSDFEKCMDIVRRSKDTLERLNLRYRSLEFLLRPELGFDLSNVPYLHHLYLYHDGDSDWPEAPGLALGDFVRFLDMAKFPVSGSLQTLEIAMLVNGKINSVQFFLDSFRPENEESQLWSALNAALTRVCLEAKPTVQNLIISFHIEGLNKDDLPCEEPFGEVVEALVRELLDSFSRGERPEAKTVGLKANFVFATPNIIQTDWNALDVVT
ncbi:hypothetical protein CPB84DRAFT_1754340 [Gymnopilus junonius]|uniref:Uncharacterized protein n=1 Tax=Gymnopilus junonius TaxID=109634 RepID=A0A9P5TEQ3_GYMJU|nr:hypothetical protein CPB84DRAFT_1754340 [Gymnopilus junonius]